MAAAFEMMQHDYAEAVRKMSERHISKKSASEASE
jgi:hypothetical protein